MSTAQEKAQGENTIEDHHAWQTKLYLRNVT